MEIRTLPLEHMGLVAGVFDQLEVAGIVDDRIPKLRNHNLEHSKVIKAMVLNALGYVGQRLYLFSEFYERLPIERLLGEGVKASDLNDDVLGRTLDAISAYGPTELFNDISALSRKPVIFQFFQRHDRTHLPIASKVWYNLASHTKIVVSTSLYSINNSLIVKNNFKKFNFRRQP